LLDLLFRNALIFDGTGNAPSISDIAIADGRIVAIGWALDASAHKVIAADGLALMPGIIDSHTHFDAQITWDPWVRPSPALGVTTVVAIADSPSLHASRRTATSPCAI
jgi:N-acyl-D-amino-acid deacylase